jgi:pentose-5-phosphate-3-epimerase/putative flippase GtrA
LAYLVYRYRYLASFTVIGFLSILLELAVRQGLQPVADGRLWATGLAFLAGMLFSFLANALFNFRVPRPYLVRTFVWFAAISLLSLGLNLAVIYAYLGTFDESYAGLRLLTAGALFAIGYSLHRRYTFDMARNFGLALYASEADDPNRLFELVGRNCDHLHVDLVDETMGEQRGTVRLDNLVQARRLWPQHPVALHVMSTRPRRWVEATWSLVDWYLLHVESEDDLSALIFQCRMRRKRIGIVWRPGTAVERLLPLLPHVDFAMVLGIRQPGYSGQEICPETLNVATTLQRLRSRYGFEVMFDGGVKEFNVGEIPAKYVVAASAVIEAADPVAATHVLRTGARYHRAA